MNKELLKQQAAEAALSYIVDDMIVGVGTGSTTNYFIDALVKQKHRIEGAVASSEATKKRLQENGIRVFEFTSVGQLELYVDGADEVNTHLQLVKGGGGALTQEKVLAYNAKNFVCIVDEEKCVDILGRFPLPVEVLPMARSSVSRAMIKLGGDPVYRQSFLTDNGNIIIDVHNLEIMEPIRLEKEIKQIPGVIENGIFALRTPNVVLIGRASGVKKMME